VTATSAARRSEPKTKQKRATDPLLVMSVEKAFRVLSAFGTERPTMSLSQVAAATGMEISAAQRFTHTLLRLGYLQKDPQSKRFELTSKSLEPGYHYMRGNRLIGRALPYLLHLSRETEEAVNLTLLEGTEIVFVSRFVSRHMLNIDIIIGTRMPAYCTAPGIAMLSRLPEPEAVAVLQQSERKAYTPSTTWRMEDLVAKLKSSRLQGFATAFDEYYHGDASIAAAVLDAQGRPEGAVNVAVSLARFTREEARERFSPLVVATARAISAG
jgi:IclR family transcriptional regulator, pca regulon regulatory protein